ncbi:MAG: DUF3783 domain-containing protein [Oscillospiraceae bacterium]|nr:DUF3783 domain-containing protein [Oscillospiraceae bacterium]
MEREKAILAYGFTKEEKNLIGMLKIRHKIKKVIYLSNNMGESKVFDVLNDVFAISNEVNLPEEKLLLFDMFSDKELAIIVDAVKSTIKGYPIMATITPISINWSLSYLMQHLVQEREEFKLRKMMKNKEKP